MDHNFTSFYFSDIKKLFLRRKFFLLTVFLVVFIMSGLFFLSYERRYLAQATFLDDVAKAETKVGSLKDMVLSEVLSLPSDGGSYIKSKTFAKKVVKKLGLQMEVANVDNLITRKKKIFEKNLKMHFHKKILKEPIIHFKDVRYKKNKQSFVYLNFLEDDFFEVLDKYKNALTKAKIDQKVVLKDLEFTISKVDSFYNFRCVKVLLNPLDEIAESIADNISIEKDKTAPNMLLLKTKHKNRFVAASILNSSMLLYIEHLKKENQKSNEFQIKYLDKRRKEIEEDIFASLEKEKDLFKENVKSNCFTDLQTEISLLLRHRQEYQRSLSEISKELKYLKEFDFENIDDNSALEEKCILYLDELKKLKNKKKNLSLTIQDSFNNEKSTSSIENSLKDISIDSLIDKAENKLNISLDDSEDKSQKKKSLDKSDLNFLEISDVKAHIQDINRKIDSTSFEVFDLKSVLKDLEESNFEKKISNLFLKEDLTKKIDEISKKLINFKNYTSKEIEDLKEEYNLEKRFLLNHILQTLKEKTSYLSSLKQKLNVAKKIQIRLFDQEIIFLTNKITKYISEKIKKQTLEISFLESKLKEIKQKLPIYLEKLSQAKKDDISSELKKNLLESLSKLIESKTLDYNLKKINSKPIDFAKIPTSIIDLKLYRNSSIVALAIAFLTFIVLIYQSIVKGFFLSKEAIFDLDFDYLGKISFKCNGITVDQLKEKDLEVLRKVIASIKDDQKVISFICSKGPNYIHYLAALLAISSKRILVIETKSDVEEKEGLYSYLEDTEKEIPIQNYQAYDYIPSGENKYFSFELLKSLDFSHMIDTLSQDYDLILIYSSSTINSAESCIYQKISDKLVISFKEEVLEDIKNAIDWADKKSKLGFITY